MKTIEICVWRTIYGEMGFSPPISAGYHYSVYDFKYNRRKEAKTVVSKCWSFLFSGDEEIRVPGWYRVKKTKCVETGFINKPWWGKVWCFVFENIILK